MADNFFLPYYNYTLTTPLTPDALQRKLARTTDVSDAHLLNPLLAKKGCKFSGYVDNNKFKLTLIKFNSLYDENDDNYKPYKVSSQKIVADFYGTISVINGVTTVKMKVRPGIITGTIFGLAIFLPPLMAIASYGDRDEIPMSGALIFSLIGYVILLFGFSFNATDTQKILDAIIKDESEKE
jgi:hypothetical protein